MTAIVVWVLFWIAMTVVCGCSAKKMAKRHQQQSEVTTENDDDELIPFDEDAAVFEV